MNQFKQNEIRGREFIYPFFEKRNIKYTFTEGAYDAYDVLLESNGKKYIGEIKYLYKYSSNSYNHAYLEQLKAKKMEVELNKMNANGMLYFFIYNDDVLRMFDITNFRQYDMIEKWAPITYNSKEQKLKRFIKLPHNQGEIITK